MTVAPSLDLDESDWDRVMETNLKAPFFLSQKLARDMVRQGIAGGIVNITSEVVCSVQIDLGAYCPSKAALHGIIKVLLKEWGQYGIRVYSLAPCFVDTVLNARLFAKKETFYTSKLNGVPLGRHSVPDELADGAVF